MFCSLHANFLFLNFYLVIMKKNRTWINADTTVKNEDLTKIFKIQSDVSFLKRDLYEDTYYIGKLVNFWP